jgi:hypothetical protein
VKTSRHQTIARRKRRIERRLRPRTWSAQPTPMYRARNIQYEHSDRVRSCLHGQFALSRASCRTPTALPTPKDLLVSKTTDDHPHDDQVWAAAKL